MRIVYGDFVIRDACADDIETLTRWWNNGRLMSYVGFPLGLRTNPEKVRAQISRDDDSNRHLMIDRAGMRIGEMSCKKVADGVYSVGITVCIPKERNHGNGKKLLSMLIGKLFSQGAQMITADADSKNLRARHVCERVGFKENESERSTWHDQTGSLHTSVYFELLPQDFVDFTKGEEDK